VVGDVDGEYVGTKIGLAVSSLVGSRERADVGIIEGRSDGITDGIKLSLIVGLRVGGL
jgi:hypothetical protein